MKSSLEHKTIRPGKLNDYSFYYSHRNAPQAQAVAVPKRRLPLKALLVVALFVAAGFFGYLQLQADTTTKSSTNTPTANQAADKTSSNAHAASTLTPAKNECAGNTNVKFIKISISKRHLWACEGTNAVHDTPVITGMEKYDSTRTPVGTYKIYAKQADTVLTGSDETGAWRDPVSYWMPFLDNQYGTYGFHDATWRDDKEFGNIDPYKSDDASHGCIELPLGASKWLYEWSPVGTMLTVEA